MNNLDKIYDLISEMTIKQIEKEKATKLSGRTLKMIALTIKLHNALKRY